MNMKKKKPRSPEEVERQKSRFEAWQKRNPSKQFKDYFAETVKAKLVQGKPHQTLGGNLCQSEFNISGQGFFKRLLSYDLKPGDVCVDYGCGTLRIGLHVIKALGPRAYWGLDVSEFLLEEGRKLIGEDLWAEKQPQLRVISPQSVAEAAAAKPAMLFSSAVFLHVHPHELAEYVENVMTIIGTDGQAIITDAILNDHEIQYSGRSWARTASDVEKLIVERGGKMLILEQTDFPLEEFGKTVKRCTLRIVHESHAA
jgi:hypothetical protein